MTKKQIVMVHGLMGSMNYFSPSAHLPNCIIHTPDLIGYGVQRDQHPSSLEQQAEFVSRYIRDHLGQACYLLGHSVGGAVAMLAAYQELTSIAGIISVEGNFTLDDAFWCSHIAHLSPEEWHEEYELMRQDPAAWLSGSVTHLTPMRIEWATAILDNQPAQTVQAQAKAVVRDTGAESYLRSVKELVNAKMPMYLIAGERSQASWHVPQWLVDAAKRFVVLPDTGHMMMLEDPARFCKTVAEFVA